MSKFVYVGPTIVAVATRNTVYDEMPKSLLQAFKTAPYLEGLCVPISELGKAMEDIRNKDGPIYRLYTRAMADSSKIQEGAR